MEVRRCKGKYEEVLEVLEEGRGPRVPRSKGSKVQGSQGPRVPRTKIFQTHIQIRA